MANTAVSEATDKRQYLADENHRKCRSRGRPGLGHALPDWDTVDMVKIPNADPRNPLSATHRMIFECARCHARKIERYRLVVARDRKTKEWKLKQYTQLDTAWDYTKTDGYLFSGGRIAPSEATEVDVLERVEAQLALVNGGDVDEDGPARIPSLSKQAAASSRRTARKAPARRSSATRKAS